MKAMDLIKKGKEYITEQDVLESLKDDYNNTVKYLDENNIDLSSFNYMSSVESFIYGLSRSKIELDIEKFDLIATSLDEREKLNLIKEIINISNQQSKYYYKKIVRNSILITLTVNLSKEEKMNFIDEVCKIDSTIFKPHMYGYNNQEDIDNKYKQGLFTKNEYEILSRMMNKNEKYSIELENEALDLLDYNPRPTSLEDAIKKMYNQNKIRQELTVNEVYIFKLYADKLLHYSNVDYKHVDILSYLDGNSMAGQHYSNKDGGTDTIVIPNGILQNLENFVNTIHHEVNHAIQHKNTKECNVEDDFEIFDYAKDSLLYEEFGNSYYAYDYNRMSFEYDAEYKAKIQTALLLKDTNKYNISSYEDYLLIAKTINQGLRYAKDPNREKYNRSLDYVFMDKINSLKEKDKERYNKIVNEYFKEKYKILSYVYNITDEGITLKKVDEIIEGVLRNDEDSKIYLALLQSKCENDDNFDINKIYENEKLKPYLERIKNAKRGFLKTKKFFAKEIHNLGLRLDVAKRRFK